MLSGQRQRKARAGVRVRVLSGTVTPKEVIGDTVWSQAKRKVVLSFARRLVTGFGPHTHIESVEHKIHSTESVHVAAVVADLPTCQVRRP